MAGRNTRASQSKPSSTPIAPPSPTASEPPPTSPTSNSPWGPSSTEQDRLMQEYATIFDEGDALKDVLILAQLGAEQNKAGNAFHETMIKFDPLLRQMAAFPPGSWDLPRPNISSWADDLLSAAPSAPLSSCRTRLRAFGARLDSLLSAPAGPTDFEGVDDHFSPPPRPTMPPSRRPSAVDFSERPVMGPPPVPIKPRHGKKTAAAPKEDAPVPNDPPCERCAEASILCLPQSNNARCTSCARSKHKCSLVSDTKPSKKSEVVVDEGNEDEDDDNEEVPESPKTKKGKGFLGGVFKNLKRTQAERSPEHSPPSTRSNPLFNLVGVVVPEPPVPHSSYLQLGSRPSPSSPSPIIANDPNPPLSSSPSLASFDSTGSESRYQHEINRLQLQLNASQEELRIQQEIFENREQRLMAQWSQERLSYQAQIDEASGMGRGAGSRIWGFEGDSKGEGSSSKGEGRNTRRRK